MIKLLENFSKLFLLRFKGELYNLYKEDQELFPAYTFMSSIFFESRYTLEGPVHILDTDYLLGYYQKPSVDYYNRRIKNYGAVMTCFYTGQAQEQLYFNIGEDTHAIFVGPGYILDETGNILIMLAGKRDAEKDFPIEQIYSREQNDVVVDNVVLFIATEFINNPIYKNIYKKFYSTFVMEGALSKEVEVRYLPSKKIDSLLYPKVSIVPSNLITPEDRINYIESLSIKDLFLFNRKAYTMEVLNQENEELTAIFNAMDNIFPTEQG